MGCRNCCVDQELQPTRYAEYYFSLSLVPQDSQVIEVLQLIMGTFLDLFPTYRHTMLSGFRKRYENRVFAPLKAVYSVYVSVKQDLQVDSVE